VTASQGAGVGTMRCGYWAAAAAAVLLDTPEDRWADALGRLRRRGLPMDPVDWLAAAAAEMAAVPRRAVSYQAGSSQGFFLLQVWGCSHFEDGWATQG
jgi:hypothetical protein